MTFHLLFRLIAAGLALTFATGSTPTASPPKAVLIDCQVIPVWCSPNDVCHAVSADIQPSDEYHFTFSKNQNVATQVSKSKFTTTILTSITSATHSATSHEAVVSKAKTTSSSSTMQTINRNSEATMERTLKPTPVPSAKPQGATVTKKMTRSGSQSISTKTIDAGTIGMLDTPHDYPSDVTTFAFVTKAPKSVDNALEWTFLDSTYSTTHFVLWRDTLRLDVTTQTQRAVASKTAADLKLTSLPNGQFDKFRQPLYDVTLLWRGTCSQPTTQLP